MAEPTKLSNLIGSPSNNPPQAPNSGGETKTHTIATYATGDEYEEILSTYFSNYLPLNDEERKIISKHKHYDKDMNVNVIDVTLATNDIDTYRFYAQKRKDYFNGLNRPSVNEGSLEWFECQLRSRSSRKQPIKLTRFRENALTFLVQAYRLRVHNDCKVFTQDPGQTKILSIVARWMCGEPSNNGIILRGGVGVGKSTMMRAIMDVYAVVEKRNIREASATDVANAGVSDKRMFRELCEEPMLAIDDLGTEPPCVKSYGNEVSPMVDLITERHKRLRFTIITTNLTEEQLKERYGGRVFDRIRELCAMLKYGGEMKSYRK